ncbi:MAG TPA: DNA mismatch repair protein MutS [Candidatus Nanoarchaeia archaeon]|nr:DNA mismatch repair protein MutS [Candidatus Nanoarchaeia archaeon]
MEIDSNNKGLPLNTCRSVLEIDSNELTPGMRQYQQAKKENPDCLIMLRMGDFYEMFYEDAIAASRELEITLTSRGKGEKNAPLAGIPYHALDTYLGRLVKKGYRVAIVEQLEDPKQAQGLVKRGLVRIVTPGTVIEPSLLNEKENNYLLGLITTGKKSNEFVVAGCDLSTGEFFTKHIPNFSLLQSEMARLNPSECILPQSLKDNAELINLARQNDCWCNFRTDSDFHSAAAQKLLLYHFKVQSLKSFGLDEEDKKDHVSAAGALLKYLIDTQKNSLSHLKKISLSSNDYYMAIDSTTFRNLELVKNMVDGTNRGSLLSILDKTSTSLGARLLRKWIKSPLLNHHLIEKRLDALTTLNSKVIVREEIIDLLSKVYDLERLISRVNYGNANPRDLVALKKSLQHIPLIKDKLAFLDLPEKSLLQELWKMDPVEEIFKLINESLLEEAPVTIREGGFINPRFNPQLAELLDIKLNSKKYFQNWEEKEKLNTKISSLKIGYTKVFGYFIEVTKKNINLVPSHYIRKQTTANSERYITEELKLEEEKILGAEEKIQQLEYDLFQELILKIKEQTEIIQQTAAKLAVLDVLCSLAKVAMENKYVRPIWVKEKVIQIKNGRHPVVEKIEPRFISNDVFLEEGEMMIITGPNTSGKSTVMRQTALIVLMAHLGSFVPAETAVLGTVDRIFTRVGAQDDLSSGQSTFMVEMLETASILNNATSNSFIILDEIGRGTSTFDGVSIAWSVAEYIYNQIKAKTMFATHYHVLNKLEQKFSKIKNYNVAVKEVQGNLIFLRKLILGGTDQSHGVHVAKLAGLPDEVVERAKEIQSVLEKDDEMVRRIKVKKLEEQRGLEEF